MVVIAVIGLVTSIILPTAYALLKGGAASESYNRLAGQLAAARALAIENGTYAGVHIQLGDATAEPDACYSAIVLLEAYAGQSYRSGWTIAHANPAWPTLDGLKGCIARVYDMSSKAEFLGVIDASNSTGFHIGHVVSGILPTSQRAQVNYTVYGLVSVEGYEPVRLPGTIAVGKINGTYVDSAGSYLSNAIATNLKDFTTCTILFSPSGQIVRDVYGWPVRFDGNDALFRVAGTANDVAVWEHGPLNGANEFGVDCVTLFDYAELKARLAANQSASDYLNEYGLFLPVNAYTGQIYPRR